MTKAEIIRDEYYKNPEFSRKKLAKKLDIDEAYIRKVIRPLKKNNIKQGHKPLEEKIDFNRTSKNNYSNIFNIVRIRILNNYHFRTSFRCCQCGFNTMESG